MILKKIINAFLILVLVIQLLPVKQVVRYFFDDNAATEEIADVSKGATKNFKLIDEDNKLLPEYGYHLSQLLIINNIPSYHFDETIPVVHAAEVQTPPPNQA